MKYLRYVVLICITVGVAILWRPILSWVSERTCILANQTSKTIHVTAPIHLDTKPNIVEEPKDLKELLTLKSFAEDENKETSLPDSNSAKSPLLSLDTLANFTVVLLISFLLAKFAKFHINYRHLWPLKKIIYAPPAWLCIIFAWSITTFFISLQTQNSWIDLCALYMPLLLFVLLNRHHPHHKLLFKKNEIGALSQKLSLLIEKAQKVSSADIQSAYLELKTWFTKKEAIEEETFSIELTSAKNSAQQISSKLLSTFEKNGTGLRIGIVGPFGCGKTSLINLIVHYLNEQKTKKSKLIICQMSVWGCDSSASAQDFIIHSILKELDYHFDCSSFARIAKEWKSFIEGTESESWKFISFLLNDQPFDQRLREISKLLQQLGYHLVVIIEDIDRNADQQYNPKQIQSLLEQLKKWLDCSIFIAGQEKSMDYTRLCDYTITPPKISVYTLKKIIWAMARYHIPTAFNDWQQPLENIPWPLLYGSNTSKNSLGEIIAHIDIFSLKDLQSLIDNLRVFKTFLQRLDEGWSDLQGEIDYFDFFLITLLRTTMPESFNFIHLNHELLQSMNHVSQQRPSDDCLLFKSKLIEYQKSLGDKAPIFNKILALLFGEKVSQILEIPVHLNFNNWPTGIIQKVSMHPFPTDYWNRAYMESLIPNEVKDKQIIEAHEQWLVDSKHDNLIFMLRDQLVDCKWVELKPKLTFHQTLSLTQALLLDRYANLKSKSFFTLLQPHAEMTITSALMYLRNLTHQLVKDHKQEFTQWLKNTYEKIQAINADAANLFIQNWTFKDDETLTISAKI